MEETTESAEDRAVREAMEAVDMALTATKAALAALKGRGGVTAYTPSFKLKKNGTVAIKINLEVKLQRS